MIGWITKRVILALPFLIFRRSFVGGMAVWLLMRKLSTGNNRRSAQGSGSMTSQRRW